MWHWAFTTQEVEELKKNRRRSLVVIAVGTKSGGREFESQVGHDGNFCDRPQPRVSGTQAQRVGQATDRDSSTKRKEQ